MIAFICIRRFYIVCWITKTIFRQEMLQIIIFIIIQYFRYTYETTWHLFSLRYYTVRLTDKLKFA